MPRATGKPAARERHRRLLKEAKGFRGARSKRYRSAKESVHRARAYAYRDRRARKREFRRLWNVRINAAARLHGLNYSRFIWWNMGECVTSASQRNTLPGAMILTGGGRLSITRICTGEVCVRSRASPAR